MCNDPQFHFLVVFNFQLAFFLGIHSCKAGSFDGQGGIIAHALYPEQRSPFKSFVHFDGDEQWTVSDGTSNKYSLLPVALHEIGHVLGLAHSNHTKAVMYRSYNKKSSSIQLDDDDVDGIQEKYGAFNYFYLLQVRITGRAGNVQFNPRDMWILQKVNFRPIKRLKWNNRKLVSREVRKIYSVLSRENSTVFSIDCFKAVALGLDDFLNKRLNGRTCQELDFRLSQPLKIFQLKFIYPGHRPKLPSLSIILSCLYLFAVLLGAGLGGGGECCGAVWEHPPHWWEANARCGLGSNFGVHAMCLLSFWLVPPFVREVFRRRVRRSLSLSSKTMNISKFQFYQQ